jgi:hypothetical protein
LHDYFGSRALLGERSDMHFPRFRVFTWIILAINVLFLIWIITGIASNNSTAADCGSLDRAACEAAENVGTAIGVGLIVGLWVAADVILGVLWLITRRKTRDCPACGRTVKRGQLQCKSCGYDFGQAARAAQQPPVSPVA